MKRFLICFVALFVLTGSSVSNSGLRHETAVSPSVQARDYYSAEYAIEELSALAGSSSEDASDVWESPLCEKLHELMNETRTTLLSYARALQAFPNTDASGGSDGPLRFYCDDFGEYGCEQVWAEPHGSFYHDGPGRDLHHLRPADPQANLTRDTQCFGNVKDQFKNCAVWPETGEPTAKP